MVSPFLPDDEKLVAVRAALPATGAGIYLNTGTCGPLPAETAAAMAELSDRELRVGRADEAYLLDTLARMDEARSAVAAVLSAEAGTVALTHATTDGMNAASWGLDWRPGDRAVTTTLEHPGGLGPLLALRRRLGVELVAVDVGDGGDDDRTLAGIEAAVTRRTRLVSVSHVSWRTGAVLPVARIAEIAHARGALVAVDGAQSAGAIPVDVAALGADLFAVSGQKWLLGPEGMGALWVSPDVRDRVRPTFAGHFAFERVAPEDAAGDWWPDARRFESSGFHRPSIVGLGRSIGWLSMFVGLEWIHRTGVALARRAADRLAAIPGVTVVTPRHQMATLVTFRIAGWSAKAALDELGARIFAIARTLPGTNAIRISVGFFNTDDEIERFAGAVELLASHTPETIPPRRTLPIVGADSR